MKKNDLILAAAVTAAAVLILAFQYFRQDSGENRVVVTVDGNLFGVYDLTDDQTIMIGDTNRVVIENGGARMEWADCPDQLCVNHRSVNKNGESIICLPNKIVVSVEGSREGSVDGIAQ